MRLIIGNAIWILSVLIWATYIAKDNKILIIEGASLACFMLICGYILGYSSKHSLPVRRIPSTQNYDFDHIE
jgi:hypothetical protein